jgi:hypothetical protein
MIILLSLAVAALAIGFIFIAVKIDICMRQDISCINHLKDFNDELHDLQLTIISKNSRITELETKMVETYLNIEGLREFVKQNIKPSREIQSAPKKGNIPQEAIENAVKKVKSKTNPKEKPNDAGNIQSN